jgi:nucleoside 2-deoxyribosyltransferase
MKIRRTIVQDSLDRYLGKAPKHTKLLDFGCGSGIFVEELEKALSEIRKSKFVIANLTGTRSSVFFEAGFAFGLNKDIIFVYDEKGGLPPEFYAKHYQCYAYKDEIELKDILKNAIAARIKK